MPGLPRPPARKALCIGVQYGESHQPELNLPGAHNDPELMRGLLVDTYGYHEDDITILVDDVEMSEEERKAFWPTRENIVCAMEELVEGARPGDTFVFHFSGHGSQVPNLDGTEDDGFDEILLPVDVGYDAKTKLYCNYIKDDEIRDILVDRVPAGARCIMVFDCCHSGSASDLPYLNGDFFPMTPWSPVAGSAQLCGSKAFVKLNTMEDDPLAGMKISSLTKNLKARGDSLPVFAPAQVTSWSACMDHQVVLGRRSGGIFVRAFVNALREKPVQTHSNLLRALTRELIQMTAKANMKISPDMAPYPLPKPQLGSLRQVVSLFHTQFTM